MKYRILEEKDWIVRGIVYRIQSRAEWWPIWSTRVWNNTGRFAKARAVNYGDVNRRAQTLNSATSLLKKLIKQEDIDKKRTKASYQKVVFET